MRNLLVLLIFTLTFTFSSCNNTIKVSEIIDGRFYNLNISISNKYVIFGY